MKKRYDDNEFNNNNYSGGGSYRGTGNDYPDDELPNTTGNGGVVDFGGGSTPPPSLPPSITPNLPPINIGDFRKPPIVGPIDNPFIPPDFGNPTPPRKKTNTILKVYQHFNVSEDIIDNVIRRVTYGMWSNNDSELVNFYTSSEQTGSDIGQYYWDIYNTNPALVTGSQVQFAISYGHINGGGSAPITENGMVVSESSVEPTKAIYAQYRNILLEPEDLKFTFANGFDSDDIWIINIERARLRYKMDPGNWLLHLSGSGGISGSIILTDDSNDRLDTNVSAGGRIFNVVRTDGSSFVSADTEPSGGLGLFYPDRGFIVLNPTAIQYYIGLSPITGSVSSIQGAANHKYLYQSLVDGAGFQARSEELITSTHYFVRVRNRDFNFSNNPTFYTSSDGSLRNKTFVGDPKTYITAIGLYDENNELLAVAKISKPIMKAFDREALIKVKLDF